MKKKGISPLVATVLLVGFTISLIVIILLWGRAYYEEKDQKEGKISELEADCATAVLLEIKSVSVDQFKLIMNLNNNGNRDIDGLSVVIKGQQNQDTIPLQGPQYKIKKLETKTIEANYTLNVGAPVEVKIVPSLKAGSRYYVGCDDKAVTYVF